MSRIALTPNASGTGTLTIAAPNTNTDRTLTLPDATGTVNTSGLANEVPAGSAGAPAIYPTGDTNTGIFFPAADTIAFSEGGVESMRIDSSGNLGLGVTPGTWASGARAMQISSFACVAQTANGAFTAGFNFRESASDVYTYLSTDQAGRYEAATDGSHRWLTAPSGTAGNAITFTQAMTLDASGNLLVGTTSTFDNVSFLKAQVLGGVSTKIDNATAVSQVSFFNPNGRVGFIGTNGTATTYNTSSDYRLKENVQPMTGALDKITQLNPVTYTWKADGSAGQGFIAHELQAVVPDCVTGEKDAVDAEGSPQYQGVDTSFLVATLVKAIQELTARVAELEAK